MWALQIKWAQYIKKHQIHQQAPFLFAAVYKAFTTYVNSPLEFDLPLGDTEIKWDTVTGCVRL